MPSMPSNMHFIKIGEDDNLEWIILWSLLMCQTFIKKKYIYIYIIKKVFLTSALRAFVNRSFYKEKKKKNLCWDSYNMILTISPLDSKYFVYGEISIQLQGLFLESFNITFLGYIKSCDKKFFFFPFSKKKKKRTIF